MRAEVVGVLGQQDSSIIVGGHRDGAAAEDTPDGAQLLHQIIRTVVSAPRKGAQHITGHGDRSESILGERIDRDSERAERADDSEAAGMDRIVADLDRSAVPGPTHSGRLTDGHEIWA